MQYPLTDLTFKWLGRYDGNDLVNEIGDNATITNADKVINNIIPFNSNIEITFPVGLNDVSNGFLYNGATPNNLIPQSFFNDIDYEHRIFIKYQNQVIDSNGVEITPYGIKQIFIYSNPLTGLDLIRMNNYCSVPEFDITAKWVDQSVAITGDGSFLSPYKTMQETDNALSDGDKVYIKSGIYTEEFSGALQYLWLQKSITWQSLGNVEIRSLATNRTCFVVNNNPVLNNIIINGENLTSAPLEYFSNSINSTLNKCYIKGGTTRLLLENANTTSKYNDCVFYNGRCDFIGNPEINRSYLYDSYIFGLANTDFNYCKFNQVTNNPILLYAFDFNFNFCDFYYNYINIRNAATTYSQSYDLTINRCAFYQGDNNAIEATYGLKLFSASNYIVDIQNCNFISILETYNATAQGFIDIEDQPIPNISNNIFNSKTKQRLDHVAIKVLGTRLLGVCKVNNNWHKSNSTSGITTGIGQETGFPNQTNNSEFIGNRIIGFKQDYPNEASTTVHGVIINGGIDIDTKYNYVSHSRIGIVIKAGDEVSYTAKGCHYNLIENCTDGIWVRGVKDLNVFNNTIVHSNTIYGDTFSNALIADENSAKAGDQFSENVLFKNNIIDNKLSTGTLIQLDSHAAANGCDCTDSILYGGQYKLNDGSVNYSDITSAQVAGFLANCVNQDPLLSDLIPQTGSYALGNGVYNANYKTGLDITTVWGDEDTIPSVITKDQNEISVDMGAYII